MRQIDYDFIASNISSLSSVAVRVYKENKLIHYYDPSHFPKDPASPYLDTLLAIDGNVNYFISPYEHFYGIVKHQEYTLILGPTFQITPSKKQIREFMFSLDLRMNYMEQYQQLMQSITPLPVEMLLHELCLIYYYISDVKLNLANIKIYDSNAKISSQNQAYTLTDNSDASIPHSSFNDAFNDITWAHNHIGDYMDDTVSYAHTTHDFECAMLACVKEGDIENLQTLIAHTDPGRAGKIAPTYLRQVKNIFITSATLLSRAAIDGGLPVEEALTLSDKYIQHAENYDNPEQVMNLQYHMVIDYTSLVRDIKKGKRYDKFMRSVTSYIREHLTEDFSVDQMAQDLFLSRSYLSTKFKKETGMTLSQYIQEQKIEKAKSLLKTTDRSILEIATYLGFSSQGYFQNVFKKLTGMTPKEYRNQ
ncbi:AraC family transcriptional regulator [Roseburia sp. AM16-25]|uniref:AraC family transcriptional regulator n=1 Tax=Roseburia sp. AM16-25 TaxID=2292065 RepID=UPI000E53E96E|nr:AraC family transcriptional regulator [Roseburia sp. AM16-25]RHO31870.1 AraC family transcriptional regulator [Roseburia sp. AM16-25]